MVPAAAATAAASPTFLWKARGLRWVVSGSLAQQALLNGAPLPHLPPIPTPRAVLWSAKLMQLVPLKKYGTGGLWSAASVTVEERHRLRDRWQKPGAEESLTVMEVSFPPGLCPLMGMR